MISGKIVCVFWDSKIQIKLFLFLCVNVRYMCFVINYQVFFHIFNRHWRQNKNFFNVIFWGLWNNNNFFSISERVCMCVKLKLWFVRGDVMNITGLFFICTWFQSYHYTVKIKCFFFLNDHKKWNKSGEFAFFSFLIQSVIFIFLFTQLHVNKL